METQSKIDTLNSALKQIVERHTPEEGIFQTSVPHLYFVRKIKQINVLFVRMFLLFCRGIKFPYKAITNIICKKINVL